MSVLIHGLNFGLFYLLNELMTCKLLYWNKQSHPEKVYNKLQLRTEYYHNGKIFREHTKIKKKLGRHLWHVVHLYLTNK